MNFLKTILIAGYMAGSFNSYSSSQLPANTSAYDIAALQAQHDGLVSFVVRYYALSEHYDSAAALLASYNMYSDALPFYLTQNDFINAQLMHDNLPTNTPEDIQYANLTQTAINLYQQGQTWYNLDAMSRNTFLNTQQYNNASGYAIGGITALLGLSPVTFPQPILTAAMRNSIMPTDTSNNGLRKSYEKNTAITSSDANSFTVFPNPTTGNITTESTLVGTFSLYTIDGRNIIEYVVNKGNTDFVMPSSLANGVYLGVFKPKNGTEKNILRIIYQK